MKRLGSLLGVALALCLLASFALANETPASSTADKPLAQLRELPPVGVQGVQWLTPVEGEKLYIGEAKVSQAERMYVAFITSSDGRTLGDLMLYVENTDIKVTQGETTYQMSGHSFSTLYTGSQSIIQMPFDLILSDLSLTGINIQGEKAECTLAYTYHYKGAEEQGVPAMDIPFDKVAVELTNYVIARVNPPVAPPTRDELVSLGFTLPALAAEEVLYVGEADVSQAERLMIAFVLSADGSEMHDVTFFIKDLTLEFSTATSTVRFTTTKMTQTVNGTFAVEQTLFGISLGNTQLTGMTVSNGEALCTLAFVYHYTGSSQSGVAATDIPLDLAQVRFQKQ